MKKIKVSIIVILLIINYTVFSCANTLEDIEDEKYFKQIQEVIINTSGDLTDVPKTYSRAVAVFDRASKTLIYGKNENDLRPMASTTKIMTATILIENEDLSKIVEVSKNSANTGGSRLGLKEGDKITLSDLLYGLLLVSGNDAAVQIAESVAGSVEEFAVLMNDKAKELGLVNTHFVTPHGLDEDEHYTTAYELAVLTDYALQNDVFTNVVNTKNYTISINGYEKNLRNTNELLGFLNGVNGVKTGFTNNALRCLVTSVSRNDFNIITVVLGADTKKIRTLDSIRLIEYTYENYELINISKLLEESFLEWSNDFKIDVNKGVSNEIRIKLGNQKYVMYPINKVDNNVKINFTCSNFFEAPLLMETKIGYATISVNDQTISTVDIVADSTIQKKNIVNYFIALMSVYSNF